VINNSLLKKSPLKANYFNFLPQFISPERWDLVASLGQRPRFN